MSTKTFEEERVFKEKISKTVCDLCDKVMETGDTCIRLSVGTTHNTNPERCYVKAIGNIYASQLDICSPECLVKNAQGISVVLNTKLIPEAREKICEKKAEDPQYDLRGSTTTPKDINYH